MYIFIIQSRKQEVRKVQLIQNRALRVVNLAPSYTSNIELHQKYKVLPPYMRRTNNLLKMVHTFILHNVISADLSWSTNDSDTSQPNSRITRQMSVSYLPLPMPKTKKYRDSCTYMGPHNYMWLDLDYSIRSEPDQNRFKLLLKRKARDDLCNITSVFA